ncbi:hypothetical protein CC1G_10673 [Coprinopsis cinerea okayama7|uniref:Uncharacterized protein n=1 Tax=Coprinopsis cinerea (strain Okayama-7 / 130 / ATCC MYA-4618 / FGSC 9003) TaxID=240176 RepID=A8NDP7_COPC7|nr:hypothetical protein CC1G_10673 [Coprinopsis cinerea okayama7\|eukprot:XP_001832824.2 hypothetical protein CC1G_10673 [Coprinopsis cinerea okayama7\
MPTTWINRMRGRGVEFVDGGLCSVGRGGRTAFENAGERLGCMSLLIAEYMQTLDLELRSPPIWLAKRYFLSHVVRELLNNTLHPDISKDEVGTAVCVVLSEGIMYMRVYALSSKEPLVTSFILVNVLTVFVAPVALLVRYAAHGEWVRFKYPELGVGCAVKRPSKHNIAVMVSYAVLLYSGLVMSIANGVAALIVPSRYRFLMAPPQAVLHSTLSIRMVLHLRDEARRQMGLDTLDKLVSECICLHDQPYSAGHPDSNGSAEVESV